MSSRLAKGLRLLSQIVLLVLLVAGALPLLDVDIWWVRSLEFPRLQFMVAAILAAVAVAVFTRRSTFLWLAVAAAAIGLQLERILPYSPLYPSGMPDIEHCEAEREISVIVANVLQDNRDYRRTLNELNAVGADVILALETDQAWQEALAPLRADLPYGSAVPLDNTYGMILYSRFPLVSETVRYVVEPDIPSILAEFSLPEGRTVRFVGLHPRPPLPGKDTGTRDAEIVLAAGDVTASPHPTIVAGDMNNVPWSETSELFASLAKVKETREGRGNYPTFFPGVPGLSWPLDSIYATNNFELLAIETLDRHGSDHEPLYAALCLTDPDPPYEEQDARDPALNEEAIEEVQEGLEQQAEEVAEGEDETMTPEAD